MSNSLYVDTGALAKWYLNEPRSHEFEVFITAQESAEISRLTVVELRCLLSRRRRSGQLDRQAEHQVLQTFDGDVANGFLTVHSLDDGHAVAAVAILSRLSVHPLRTLDALHLAIAVEIGALRVATADRVMAEAASALGLTPVRFD